MLIVSVNYVSFNKQLFTEIYPKRDDFLLAQVCATISFGACACLSPVFLILSDTGRYPTVGIYYTRTNSSATDTRARNETTPVQGTWPHIPRRTVREVYVFRMCVHTNWNFRTICTVLTPRWIYLTYIGTKSKADVCPPFEKFRTSTDRAIFQPTYFTTWVYRM